MPLPHHVDEQLTKGQAFPGTTILDVVFWSSLSGLVLSTKIATIQSWPGTPNLWHLHHHKGCFGHFADDGSK